MRFLFPCALLVVLTTTDLCVGQGCSTETVTDYWVSCTSTSCITTSSTTITACDITATTATNDDYCPLGVTIGPSDDLGDYPAIEPLTDIGVLDSVTLASEVSMSGTAYTVTSGSIVILGTTFSIPSVTIVTVVSLNGSPATILPGYIAEDISITATYLIPVTSTSSTIPLAASTPS